MKASLQGRDILTIDDVRDELRLRFGAYEDGREAYARAIGLSREMIYRVLRGDNPPNPEILSALGLEPCFVRISQTLPSRPTRLREIASRIMAEAVTIAGGNKVHAARDLGIGRSTLYRHLAAIRAVEPDQTGERSA